MVYSFDTLQAAYIELLESPQCDVILIELEQGWNMFGYTSSLENINVSSAFGITSSNILIMKDNNGNQYWPEFNFNSIGNFIPGAGYQIKVNNNFTISFLENSCELLMWR